MMDFIVNGQATGGVANKLLLNEMDPNMLRPYIAEDGNHYITKVENGVARAIPVSNVTATLRKDEWKLLDDVVVKIARQRLKLVADIRGAGLQFVIPNGMGKTVLETETQSDINPASVSMDTLREAENDRPLYELSGLPLPIIHKEFHFSARQLATSRNGATPLDTSMAEMAGRKVAEEAEKMALGVSTVRDQFKWGGNTIYGLTDFPNRLTKTITSPTASGWAGSTLVTEVLAMRAQSVAAFHYGPWMLYVGTGWDQYLDDDYSSSKGDNTLRERVEKIEGIQDVRTLDYLSGYSMILVQMTTDVIREVVGMEVTTVQWDERGGMKKNFMVMAILVPQLRADQNSNTGIVHATV